MAPTTLHDVNKEYDRWVKNAVLSPGDSEIKWNKGNCTADHHYNYNNQILHYNFHNTTL